MSNPGGDGKAFSLCPGGFGEYPAHRGPLPCGDRVWVTKLPRYDVPEGTTAWEYLNKLCREGLAERYNPVTEELEERLDYELNTIKTMGYVDYFLIVWDFIHYAREQGIMVGPGRGSAREAWWPIP